jgi:CBS domain-containing membrane protein
MYSCLASEQSYNLGRLAWHVKGSSITPITWNDFFKFIKVGANETFPEKFRAFIRRTPDVSANKPESVSHIMSASVSELPESTHIEALIPLISTQGYRQIPIVNNENRLLGMVYQANLIAELYNEQSI